MLPKERFVELYELFLTWLRIRVRSPIANWLSKAAFLVGALLVSTPLIEHLVFTAVLKHVFEIDLGISVPDANAYVAGCSLMLGSLAHNLIFVRLSQRHAENVQANKTSTYKELWVLVDQMVDSTVRLTNLYCTKYRDSDQFYAATAEDAILKLLEHARTNRPFYFSDILYQKITSLASRCMDHTRSFRACISMKQEGSKTYDFALAEKSIQSEYHHVQSQYDEICGDIRSYIETV